jgi:hypothetical protein
VQLKPWQCEENCWKMLLINVPAMELSELHGRAKRELGTPPT